MMQIYTLPLEDHVGNSPVWLEYILLRDGREDVSKSEHKMSFCCWVHVVVIFHPQ